MDQRFGAFHSLKRILYCITEASFACSTHLFSAKLCAHSLRIPRYLTLHTKSSMLRQFTQSPYVKHTSFIIAASAVGIWAVRRMVTR